MFGYLIDTVECVRTFLYDASATLDSAVRNDVESLSPSAKQKLSARIRSKLTKAKMRAAEIVNYNNTTSQIDYHVLLRGVYEHLLLLLIGGIFQRWGGWLLSVSVGRFYCPLLLMGPTALPSALCSLDFSTVLLCCNIVLQSICRWAIFPHNRTKSSVTILF